jgi:probable F420-dependent oxidoreductase
MADPLILPDSLSCGMVMAAQDGPSVRDMAVRMEAAKLDSIWVGDHVSFHIPILESLSLLSFIAAATQKIRLCTGIYLLPLRHPTTSAKVAATLDVLSEGRLTLGIGVGGEFPPEFEACGIPVEERGPRTDEGIEVMRRLWTEDGVVHQGRHFQFDKVTLAPKPVTVGGPPIIVGGRRGPSFRRAGTLGDGYISHMCSAEQFTKNMASITDHARRAGRSRDPFETASFLFTVMDDDYEAARSRATALLGTIYRRDFTEAAPKYCLLGRPENFLEQMQEFARAGSRHFVFSMLSDPTRFLEAYEKVIAPGLAQIDF